MSELLAKTREICRMLEIKPARSKGQNFLINEKIYDDIIRVANLKPTETVLEIGPGLGFLTARLAKAAGRILAVELDDKLAAYLQMAVDAQDIPNVEVFNEDILRFNLAVHLGAAEKFKVVANLPYNITSIFLRTALSGRVKPDALVLMLQKEVAERITAEPPDMSLLAVSVQYYAEAEIIRSVKAGNFWPEPEVDSAIIRLETRPPAATDDKMFFRIVRSGFSAKRKMLKNNLASSLKLESRLVSESLTRLGLDLKVRAEELSLENWRKLVAAISRFVV